MISFENLQAELQTRGEQEDGPMFMGKPDRWYDKPHWRCSNDHVSTTYLKSEERGAVCLACGEAVLLTFPEDRDGPLSASKSK